MRAMIRVFVSSKQDELAPERAALTQALRSPEWDNFTFEWSGAYPDSARDVYLKQVAECDIYLGIFFKAYSQATVDEYHEAKQLGKPILIYLKDCAEREPALTKFILDEIQPAYKYQGFGTTDELVEHLPDIRRALDAEVQKRQCQAYLDALVTQTELLELAGIVDTGEQERPKLQEIFVALSAAEEVEERDERKPKDRRERERPIKTIRRVTINEALREHRSLMILGDPGAGKSTLLRYLTLVAALSLRAPQGRSNPQNTEEIASSQKTLLAMTEAEPRLPILIRLSSFARSGQSFVEYFETYVEKQLHVSLGKRFFERALEGGQAIVCLDGLDEVSQPAQRIEVRNAITALSARYPRNRFIVSSRVAGYDSASLDKRAFAHHTIVPFGEKEIQSFVEKWYTAREREPEQARTRSANLFNDLKANERLLKLAENPLMLTIIALVHQRAQGKLPDARVELYDRCADTLIEEWDKWKGLAPEDRARPYYQLRRRLLERAAYWMHIESQEADVAQVSKRALEMKVAEFLVEDKTLNLSEDTAHIEAKQFVALATSRTGILVEREQGAVSFIHLTFQEYFAASDLYWRYRRTPNKLWQAIQPHLYESRWLEVILLLLGRLNDDGDAPSIIVAKILREHDKFDDVIHRDLFLAARCLADSVNVHEPLQDEIVNKLLKFALDMHPQYHSLRTDSIEALGTLRGNVRAGKSLLGLAQDAKEADWVRRDAAQALGQLGRMDDAVRLLSALMQEQKVYELARNDPAIALRQLGRTDDAAIQGLLALAQDTQVEGAMRSDIVYELGQLGRADDAVIQSLLALAEDDLGEGDVRSSAAQALGQLGRTEDEVRLLSALVQDNKLDESVQYDVAVELGELGRTDDALRLLLALAQDKEVFITVRCNAVSALGEFGRTENTVQLLLAIAQDTQDLGYVRSSAAQALGQLGRADDAARLLLALAQDDQVKASVRRDAAEALGRLGRTDDAVRLLLALAQGNQARARIQSDAARALGRLGCNDDTVIQGLLAIARDAQASETVRNSATQALARLGRTDDAMQLFFVLARDTRVSGIVRNDAVLALGILGQQEPRVALALLELANEKNRVPSAAYNALKETVGNLRYAELDNGQKRIKRTRRKAKTIMQKAVGRKRKAKSKTPPSVRNDRAKKSQIENLKS